jgi:hypothetical protein
MTIAVFNKGEFVDFWLNEPTDKSWVERTISAKGWLRQDVEVYLFELARNGSEVISFDANKNLQKMKQEEIDIEVVVEVDGQMETHIQKKKIWVVEQTFNKIPFYLNGVQI